MTKTVSLNSRVCLQACAPGASPSAPGASPSDAAVQGRLSKSRGTAAPAAVLAVCLAPAPGNRDVDARFAKVFCFSLLTLVFNFLMKNANKCNQNKHFLVCVLIYAKKKQLFFFYLFGFQLAGSGRS